jgi:cellobiose transport system permease protein
MRNSEKSLERRKRNGHVSYSKWGLIFIIPFFVIFLLFQFVPLFQTFYYSFFEYYQDMLEWVGPNFIGVGNYVSLFTTGSVRTFTLFGQTVGTFWISDLGYYSLNTLIIWLIGFIPQIIISLLLAVWFTDARLNLHCTRFFKTVIYMPNLVMAAAYGMLFFVIFAQNGPVMQILVSIGWLSEPYDVTTSQTWVRLIIAFINFLMWFGNTTILLMAGIMGIDPTIYESAMLDGSSSFTTFRKITMPLLKPIFLYVVITSLIGGIQLFDVAQIFTRTTGGPNLTSETLMMYLYKLISVKDNYGEAGALSVMIFVVTAILSMTVFKVMHPKVNELRTQQKEYRKRLRQYKDCTLTKEEIARNESSYASAKEASQ